MVPPGLIIWILAAWFVVSAIVQIRLPATRRLRRLDPFGLLPRWNLFSPRPIQTDLIVRYRRWDRATGPCDWVPLPYPGERRIADAFFSRRRRSKRTIYNQAERVVTIYRAYQLEPAKVIGSLPYRHLLARVTREARQEMAWGVQFQVVRVSRATGEAQVAPLFRSAIHSVPEKG
jgi:hypothetical protein